MTGRRPALAVLRRVVKRRQGADRAFELHIDAVALEPGSSLALVGPSGCGKSTLIDILALALRPDGGEAFDMNDETGRPVDVLSLWEGRKLDQLADLRARQFGYVLQTGGLLPFLSVARNIALPQRLAGRRDDVRVRRLAERLGIAETLGELPGRLSVGQRQRVAIARALAHRPPIILADEPTASLDPINAASVFGLFLELVAEDGAALVVATHDRALAEAHGIPIVDAAVSREGGTSVTIFNHGDVGATPWQTARTGAVAEAS